MENLEKAVAILSSLAEAGYKEAKENLPFVKHKLADERVQLGGKENLVEAKKILSLLVEEGYQRAKRPLEIVEALLLVTQARELGE